MFMENRNIRVSKNLLGFTQKIYLILPKKRIKVKKEAYLLLLCFKNYIVQVEEKIHG